MSNSKKKAVSKTYREGSRVATAHEIFGKLQKQKAPKELIIAKMEKGAKIEPSTANNWYYSFRRQTTAKRSSK